MLVRHGIVTSVRVDGHAGYGVVGSDPVCAAVTVLVRSTARLLASQTSVRVRGRADREGSLSFEVVQFEEAVEDWLKGVTALFLRGLEDLAAETELELMVERRTAED